MRWCAYPDEVYYLKYAKTGIDIDFYLPSVGLAVQAAYSISGDAREREVGNLKKLAQTSQEAARLVIVTYEEEETIIEDGVTIETVPLYILRGKILSPEGKLRVLVNKALGQPDIH